MKRRHLLIALVLASAATRAQNDYLNTRPDFQNQLYLAAPTNAPGTSLAQPKSIALFSGSIGDAANPIDAAPNDGLVFLARSVVGQSFGAPPVSLGPPVFVLAPSNTIGAAGGAVTFSAVMDSGTPLTFQWLRNGVPLVSATNAVLTFGNVQPANAGNYTVIVSNAFGSVTSQVTTLTVETAFVWNQSPGIVGTVLNGHGVGWADYDGDGDLDSYVVSFIGSPALFRNDGNGVFTAVTTGVLAADDAHGTGVAWADYDNDGRIDVFVGHRDNLNDALYHNEGGGVFTPVSGSPVTSDGADTFAGVWADYDRDGWLDLFVARRSGAPHFLYHNNGDGTFTAINNVLTSDPTPTIAPWWFDYDNDGWADLFLAGHDGQPNALFRNLGQGNFAKIASGDLVTAPVGGGNCALADYDNDGFTDIYLSDYVNSTSKLYRNNGNGTFSKITNGPISELSANLAGPTWGDYDNDGFLDLFVATQAGQNDRLFHNNGDGTFAPATHTIVSADGVWSIGGAWADHDRDGDLDLMVSVNGTGPTFLYDNLGNSNSWLEIRCLTGFGRRDAIGAKLKVVANIGGALRTLYRDIFSGYGVSGNNGLMAHFGLGDATNIDVLRIEWPSGIVQTFSNVAPRQFLTIQEQTTFYFAVNGSGSVSYSPVQSNYFIGEPITLTATPRNTNWTRFLRWSDGNTNATRSYSVGLSNILTAIFTNFVTLEHLAFTEWEANFGGSGVDRLHSVVPTADGGYLLGGYSDSGADGNKMAASLGANDFWIIKTDATGHKQWEKAFGGTARELLLIIHPTADGGYLLPGYSESTISGNKTNANIGYMDFWVVKIDASGTNQWQKVFGGLAWDEITCVEDTADGGYLLIGNSFSGVEGNKTSPGFGSGDFWLVKIDVTGNKQWERAYGGSGDDGVYASARTADGGYILAGRSDSGIGGNKTAANFGSMDGWVVKIDSNGNKEWDRAFGGTGYDGISSVLPTADGGYVLGIFSDSGVGGNKGIVNFGGYDYWLVKIDAQGNKQWERTFGGPLDEYMSAMEPTVDGGFLLAGQSSSGVGGSRTAPSLGGIDMWVVKVNANGDKEWDKAFGGTQNEGASLVRPLSRDALLVGGESESGVGGNKTTANYGLRDYWLVRATTFEAPIGTPAVLVNGILGNDRTNIFNTLAPVPITLTSTWNGPIHFTTDGSEPDFNSPLYDSQNPPQVTPPATVKAIAYFDDNYFASELYVDYSEVVSTRLEYVPLYTVNISTPGGGTVSANPSASSYLSNSVITILATNLPGWTFLGWQGGVTSTNPVVSVTMNSNFTAQAIFGTPMTTNATVQGSIGRTPALALYPYGSTVRLTALPAANRFLTLWSGALSGSISPQELTVTNANPVVGASFGTITGTNFGLTVQIVGEGTVSYTPATNRFGSNAVVTLTATPKPGWTFDNWSGSSDSILNPLALVMNTNKTVTANFSTIQPPSIVTQPTNQSVPTGESVTLATVAAGTAPLSYQWRFNGTNIATEEIVFSENFENYAPGSNLLGQGGWQVDTQAPNSVITITNGTLLPTEVLQGRAATGLGQYNMVQHFVTVDPSRVMALQFTAYATTNQPRTSNAGLYWDSDTNRYRGWLAWQTHAGSSPPDPRWSFIATTNSPFFITNGFDRAVEMTLVADGLVDEMYGTYDFGSGPVETPHFKVSHADITALDTIRIYVDHRDVPLSTGMEIDNIAAIARLGSRIVGVQSDHLTITNFRAGDAGNYSVVVTSPYGSVTSSVAVLTLSAATNQPPAVAITSPAAGANFTAPASIALSASAMDSDGTVTNVSLYSGAVLIGRITNAPFNFTWNNVGVGSYSLTAVATDNGGLTATSAPVNITVTTAIPDVVMTSPTNGNSFIAPANILLKALVSDADNSVAWVDFFNDTTLVGSVTNPPYQFIWSGVGNGSYLLSAVVHDSYGPIITSSPPVSVSVGTLATNVPVFYWSNTVSVNEGAGAVTLHILKNANSVAANIGYSTRDGSATAGGATPDYDAAVSNLTFAAGETVKPVIITIRQDSLNEGNQFFFVTLFPPSEGSIINNNEATVTILDDDVPGTNSFLGQVPPSLPPSPLGNLRMNISPANIFPQWKLSWETDWRDNVTMLRGMTPGNYEVAFKPVAGWLEPLATVVPVAGGVTNDFFPAYSNSTASQIGALVVTIEPPLIASAVNTNARGQWRREGEGAWHDSGERLDGIAAGSYTIEFKTVSDPVWIAPGAIVVSVPANAEADVTGNYYIANTSPGEGPRVLNTNEIRATAPPYGFCGQLLSPLGWGSGTVVKGKVVLTAAHVVFDDYALAYVPNSGVKWFFQRHAGFYEPAPQTPRGWIVLSGYAAQRTADASPGVSTAAAQELDVAALYFYESVGRGGYSGYLVSTNDELINAAQLGTIVGYPVENVPPNERGQMHATPLQHIQWNNSLAPHVFPTTDVKTYPGNSGGPLCIQFTNSAWYPAAIFLGGSDNTLVRVIDTAAAGLIIQAEQASEVGIPETGGEPPRRATDCPTCSPLIYGYMEVTMQPTNIGTLGGGYRFKEATNGVIFRDAFNRFVVLGNTPWTLEFLPSPYSIAPTNRTITTQAGQTNRVLTTYKTWGQVQSISKSSFRLLGSSGSVYRIDFSPRVGTNAVWTPVRTQTVGAASVTLSNLVNSSSNAFFRAVLLP